METLSRRGFFGVFEICENPEIFFCKIKFCKKIAEKNFGKNWNFWKKFLEKNNFKNEKNRGSTRQKLNKFFEQKIRENFFKKKLAKNWKYFFEKKVAEKKSEKKFKNNF